MRTCVIVLVVLAACEAEREPRAPTQAPPPDIEKTAPPKVDTPPVKTEEREAEPKPNTDRGPKRSPSRFDPPADLAHLATTSPELRKEIDAAVAQMMDFNAGRESLDAKRRLIRLGKPAFPRILGAMAKVRDTITDDDNENERLIESSLKLADEALREIDGWLTAKGKSTLRPGSEKRYIAYICRLHYKRWILKLRFLDEMPGPFDPSREYGPSFFKTLDLRLQIVSFLDGDTGALEMFVQLFGAEDKTLKALDKDTWKRIEKIPERMKKERTSRKRYGRMLLWRLNHDDVRIRTLARDCLRILYDKTIYYDTNAPPARREQKMLRWAEIIDAADK